jgi:hypothetical protein
VNGFGSRTAKNKIFFRVEECKDAVGEFLSRSESRNKAILEASLQSFITNMKDTAARTTLVMCHTTNKYNLKVYDSISPKTSVKDMSEEIFPRDLSENDYKNAVSFFEWMRRNWALPASFESLNFDLDDASKSFEERLRLLFDSL